MPALVGDAIMSVRALIPDMPGVLLTPTQPTLALVPTQGATLSGTYYVRVTVSTPWGESAPSPEVSTPVTLGNGLQVSANFPVGAATARVYLGTVSGGQNQYFDTPTLPFIVTGPGNPGIPPVLNRAYLPDTDGPTVPAAVIYAWLREALTQASDYTGGIYDATGINTTEGYAMYNLIGGWKRMSHAWVDGWPFDLGNKAQAYYRNKVTTSGSGIVFTDLRGVTSLVEYYPVPDRTGGQATLVTAISATDTTIQPSDLSNYELEYGLALIGNEIVAYQDMSQGVLSGCLRGLGGTRATAWPIGTPVLELNGRFAGYRYAAPPRLGDSFLNLDAPPSWDTKVQLYLESRYRSFERKHKEASDLRNQFEKECRALGASQKVLLGPRQVGDTLVNEVYNAGLGGGWLLP